MNLRAATLYITLVLSLVPAGEAAFAAEHGAPEPAARKTTQSESYLVIEPLYASIIVGSGPRGLLLVEMGLDVPDGEFRAKVDRALPVLRDAYVRMLLTYAATAVRPWRQPSVEDIAMRLQAVTDKVMGATGARVLMAQTAVRLSR